MYAFRGPFPLKGLLFDREVVVCNKNLCVSQATVAGEVPDEYRDKKNLWQWLK